MITRHFFILLFLFSFSVNLYSQRLITGKVADLRTKDPVQNVDVSIYKGTAVTTTNKSGYFQLTIQEGDSIVLMHPDYQLGIISVPEADVFSVFIQKVNDYPAYLEGEAILYKYLQENLKYPRAARNKRIEGMLVIQLSIDAQGNISGCEALNDLGGKCAEEAIEIFKKIPGRWSAHSEENHFIFPIIFQIGMEKKNFEAPDIELGNGKIMEAIYINSLSTTRSN